MKLQKYLFAARATSVVIIVGFVLAACREAPQPDESAPDKPSSQIEPQIMEESKAAEPEDIRKKIDAQLMELRKQHSYLMAKEQELQQFQRELNVEQLRLAKKNDDLRNKEIELLEKEHELHLLEKKLEERFSSFKSRQRMAFGIFGLSVIVLLFSIYNLRVRKKQKEQAVKSKVKDTS
ncbi:MAG: hypothetical protein ACE5IW_12175 [bacterium]